MNTGKRFTKIDVLVTVICLTFLAVNLPVISSSGRTHAKTDVCKANLRQLTAAWQLYAEDNGGKLVNGAPMPGAMTNPPVDPRRIPDPAIYPGCTPMTIAAAGLSPGSINRVAFAPLACPADESPFCYGTPQQPWHLREKPWTGPAWRDFKSWDNVPPPAPQDCQKCAVETGALYKYLRQNKIYTCPNGRKGELITYSIFDGMNGQWMFRYNDPYVADAVRALCHKTLGAIKKPSDRGVFIDEGASSCDSYAVSYPVVVADMRWNDFPPVRHGNGMTVSYADGHAEWWKWKGKQTITYGKMHDANPNPSVGGACRGYNPLTGRDMCNNYFGVSCDAVNDLYKMQVTCWGSVGYTNPIPGCELSSD